MASLILIHRSPSQSYLTGLALKNDKSRKLVTKNFSPVQDPAKRHALNGFLRSRFANVSAVAMAQQFGSQTLYSQSVSPASTALLILTCFLSSRLQARNHMNVRIIA